MARILIIEDNAQNVHLMQYLLEANGHAVAIAGDGDRAIELAHELNPDLILCDIHLPDRDGYEVARDIRKVPGLRGTPLLAVTALSPANDREKRIRSGYDGCISKPLEPLDFLAKIHAVLEGEGVAATPQTRPAAGAANPAPWPARTAVVVVADDSPGDRESTVRALRSTGYEVSAAGTVADALELAEGVLPDLILSGLRMPGEDEMALIRKLNSEPRLATIPVVHLSSSVRGQSQARQVPRDGVIRVLSRPIELQRLLKEIAECLDDASGR